MRGTILFVAALFMFRAGGTAAGPKTDYGLPAEAYKTRMIASDPAAWRPVACPVTAPTGGVTLEENSPFRVAMERNIDYLKFYSVDHLLYPFRVRAGVQNPPDDRPQVGFWDTDLRGSSAGRFMMGAGNTLRWMENAELRARLDALIDGVEKCREEDGYILAYPRIIDSLRSEEANYARAWFTHGLIEAAIAGNPKAYGLLRGHADCFNRWEELHPKLIYWSHNSHQGHIASTRTYLSPVGKPEDLQLAEKYYLCDWWMDDLAAERDEALWQYPLQNPHCYLITSFEAYLDHYLATGEQRCLDAALGAWRMIHDKWEHVGGSIAICENQWDARSGKRVLKHWDMRRECSHPPRSYYLTGYGHTGEICGSAFWIKFNQRLHRLYPDDERYVAEIEKSIYNIILACQTKEGWIRYHAIMEGRHENPKGSHNTCCEGQGTRILGSLPEYIYSVAPDGLYVNMYEPSTIQCEIGGKSVGLTQHSSFPDSPLVGLTVSTASPVRMRLHVRIPSWAARAMEVSVNGKKAATGNPGSYVTLSRSWRDSDRVDFTLPMELKLTKYTGADSVAGYDRYAAEYGPILLAAAMKERKANPEVDFSRLKPNPSRPLHFDVEGDSTHRFMPYLQISDEWFTIYPLSAKAK
ncbi:MAG: glycoside hydrolase family 127 protein [Rikenellaceae bacterium]|jgi:DUF1680 family protein|nr:glycoside hydrolase family 127 protein [Rikenellaceae bacterium]